MKLKGTNTDLHRNESIYSIPELKGYRRGTYGRIWNVHINKENQATGFCYFPSLFTHTFPCWQLCSTAQVPKKQLQVPQVETTGVFVCSKGPSEQWYYAYLRTQSFSHAQKRYFPKITQAIATTQSLSL